MPAGSPQTPGRASASDEIVRVAFGYGGDCRTSPWTVPGRLTRRAPHGCALAARGLALILSSNTQRRERRWAALAAGIDGLFRAVLMPARIGLRKPDPDSCALVTTVAHCRPGEVLRVGNNLETDVVGPARCGMRTALVRPAGITAEERQRLPPGALVISHVKQLPPLLDAPPP